MKYANASSKSHTTTSNPKQSVQAASCLDALLFKNRINACFALHVLRSTAARSVSGSFLANTRSQEPGTPGIPGVASRLITYGVFTIIGGEPMSTTCRKTRYLRPRFRARFFERDSLTTRPLLVWDLSWPLRLGLSRLALFSAER